MTGRLFDLSGVAAPADYRPDQPPSLEGFEAIVLDAETNGLDWSADARPVGWAVRGLRAGAPAFYLPFAHRGGQNLDESRVREWMDREVRGKMIVGLNLKFDAHHAREWGVDIADDHRGNRFVDVGHLAALLDDHKARTNLDALAREELGRGKVDLGIDGARIHELPAGLVAAYAREDVNLPAELYAAYWPRIVGQDLEEVAWLEADVLPAVLEMERNAVRLDVPKLERWLVETQQDLEDTLWEIFRQTALRIEPNKTADLAKLLRLRGHRPDLTEKGNESVTDVTLRRYADDPVVALLRRACKVDSLRTKFLLPYDAHRRGDVLRFHLHQLRVDDKGTVSGRFSMTDRNLQQVMKPSKQRASFGFERWIVRELFIPESGIWIAADARQIEYRLLADYARAPQLLAAYARNPLVDFHNVVMEMVHRIEPTMIRDHVKNINFAKAFGGGTSKIAEMLGVDEATAAHFVRSYDAAFPEIGRLLSQVSRVAERRGHVRTLLGRRARFPDGRRLHSALNRVVQGTAADINKRKLVEVHRERRALGITLRLTVHDEMDMDAASQEVVPRLAQLLDQQTTPTTVPILWEVSSGANWAEAH